VLRNYIQIKLGGEKLLVRLLSISNLCLWHAVWKM